MDHTLHGPAREGFVADHLADERLCGHNAAQHAHRRTRVATVEGLVGRRKRHAASPHFNDIALIRFAFPSYTQHAHASQGAGAIRAGGIIFNPRWAFGEPRQHRIAMRDGFISWQLHAAANVARRTHEDLRGDFHGTIWRLSRPALSPRRWLLSGYPLELLSW